MFRNSGAWRFRSAAPSQRLSCRSAMNPRPPSAMRTMIVAWTIGSDRYPVKLSGNSEKPALQNADTL
jgi:hypothetical protein